MTKTILSVVILAIVVMAIAVPVIAGSQTRVQVQENAFEYRAAELDLSTGQHNITFSYSEAGANAVVSVNGIEIGALGDAMLVGKEVILCWLSSSDKIICLNVVDCASIVATRSGASDTVLTVTDGTATFDGGAYINIPSMIVPVREGDLAATTAGYASPGDTCYWVYLSNHSVSLSDYLVASGDPWQLDQIDAYSRNSRSGNSWTGNPTSIQTSDVGETSMKIGTLKFPAEAYFTTGYLMFVPFEYTVTTTAVSGSVKTLIDMIPLLMVVGLMVATVAAYVKFKE